MFTYPAKILSVILHPLFIISYVLFYLIQVNPYIFGFANPKSQGLLMISVVTISFMFPMIAILLMKGLGLIESIEMKDKNERIGPLIVTGLFFMWLYMNIRKNDLVPEALSFFVLGCTIAVFMALLINSFSKISLHTIGAGGFAAGMIFIVYHWSFGSVFISLSALDIQIEISDRLTVMLVLILAGLTGMSRLYLKAHQENEIYGGYMVGILAQIIAFRIFF